MHIHSPLWAPVLTLSVWRALFSDHRSLAWPPDAQQPPSDHSPPYNSLAAVLPGAATFLKHHVHFVPFLEGELCNPNRDLLTALSSAHAEQICWSLFLSRNTRRSAPLDKGLQTLSQRPTALWVPLRYLERHLPPFQLGAGLHWDAQADNSLNAGPYFSGAREGGGWSAWKMVGTQ